MRDFINSLANEASDGTSEGMHLEPDNEDEARLLRRLRRFEAMVEYDLGHRLTAAAKRELFLTLLSVTLDRCTDDELRDLKDKLASHPVSGSFEGGALDLVAGKLAIRELNK